jgi:acetyltransferase-like isoleucine patch superfamily enzyme
MTNEVFVHPQAINESAEVGPGTRIWAFAHVMKRAVVGARCNIGDHAFIESGARIGNGVIIKNGVAVWEGVVLEDGVFAGPFAVFTNDRFPRSRAGGYATRRYADKRWLEPTVVREGATLGANCTVMCGAVIGRFAMVAANAFVRGRVPDFALVAGTPARIIGHVCACGLRLPPAGELRCGDCGLEYERAGEGLRMKEGRRT